MKKFEFDFKGKPLIVEIDDLASQTDSSLIIRYQETVVLITLVIGKQDLVELDYLPLSVEYEEKFYAAGKIGGSRFVRRETRPSEEAILTARLIDRSVRPLFPKNLRRNIQIVATVLSLGDFDPDFLSLFGVSLAVNLSEIPWQGPVAGIRLVKTNGQEQINPDFNFRENPDFDVFISALKTKGKSGELELVNMIELKAKEAKEEEFFDALPKILAEIKTLLDIQSKITKEINPLKNQDLLLSPPENIVKVVKQFFKENSEKVLKQSEEDKKSKFSVLHEALVDYLKEKEATPEDLSWASFVFEEEATNFLNNLVLKQNKRPDGRDIKEIRPLSSQVGFLPRVHGSAIFKRGLTHILSTVTLAAPSEQLMIENIEQSGSKRYIHHYNFPPYSVGEIGSLRKPPSRREIGHGALAEKALEGVIPSEEEFPYTIRVVSEVLSSNGSSSMGSTCGSTLALMDAGVPIKNPVAGIALGFIGDIEGEYKIITDIQGPEDHYGLMDFKVAGSKKGITAIQMDVKNLGLTGKILEEAVWQAREAREFILENMEKAISEPRKEISPYAPKIITLTIDKEKIGLLIGPGGKTIQGLIKKYSLQSIDVDEDGRVFVSGEDKQNIEKAIETIKSLTKDYQIGEILKGKVVKILDFGAIIELDQFHSGLLHISEIANKRIPKVEDVLKEGQEVTVKIIRIDPDGKMGLSIKALNNDQ